MLQAKISTAEVCFVFVTTGIVLFFMRQLFGTKYFCRIYEEMPFTDFFQRNYGFEYYEFVKFYGIGPCLEIAVIELENKVTLRLLYRKIPAKTV